MNRWGPRTHFYLPDIYSRESLRPQLQFCADRQCLEPLEARASPWEQADIIPRLWGGQGSPFSSYLGRQQTSLFASWEKWKSLQLTKIMTK